MALIGREAAVGVIGDAIVGERVAVVRGAGGIGKTVVATEAASRSGRSALHVAGIDFLGHQRLLPFERALGRPLVGDLESIATQIRSAVGPQGVIVVDNLQWADQASINLLPALAARGPLVLAMRTLDVTRAARSELERLDPIVVELAPLQPSDARCFLGAIGPGLPGRVVDDVLRMAAGNPLLIELLAHNHGSLDPHGQDLVESMVLALPPEALDLLARLSVGLRVSGGETGADVLVDAGMARRSPDGWCALEAELLATVALRTRSDRDRRTLHLLAANAADSPAIAAEHLLRAGERSEAYRMACDAIEATEPNPPSGLLRLALEVAPDSDRWPLVERTVRLLVLEGDLESANVLTEAERSRGYEGSRFDTVDAFVTMQRGDGHRAAELLDRAVATAPDEHMASILALRAGARASLFDVAGARADATLALELGATGDSAPAARFVLAGTALLSGDESWRDQLPLAVAEARCSGSRPLEVRAGITLAYGLFLSGDRDEAVDVSRELIAAAVARHDEQSEFAIAKMLNSHLVFCDLAPERVLVRLDGLLRHPATRDDLTGGWSVAAIGWVDRGDLDRAADAVARAELEAHRGGPNAQVAASWALAELAWAQDSPAWTEEHARHGIGKAMLLNPAHANCASLVAWSQLESGRSVEVDMPYIPFPALEGLAVEIAAVQALAAGEHERSIERFGRAAELHGQYLRRSALRCTWGVAEAQRRSGDLAAALVTLNELEESCIRSGITALLPRVVESVHKCKPAVGPGSRGRPRQAGAVTDRQQEILSLVHGGLRTPEIAHRLGLSPATVDTHIRGAMSRLGVSSRAEAARRSMQQARGSARDSARGSARGSA